MFFPSRCNTLDSHQKQLQMMQWEEQVKELRLRSLTVLKDWHEAVEGINACVEDWDQRLRGVEILVRGRDKVLGEEESY